MQLACSCVEEFADISSNLAIVEPRATPLPVMLVRHHIDDLWLFSYVLTSFSSFYLAYSRIPTHQFRFSCYHSH